MPSWLAALAISIAGCSGGSPAPPRVLVLISIDTLRADHLGCYGNRIVQTPHMDRLAAEGVVFDNHVSSCPTTLNSHTSLMTGTYGHTHGAARNGFVVREGNTMLAEALRDSGYATAGFAGAFPLHTRFGFSQGFDHYDAAVKSRSGDQVNDRVLRWLDGQDAERLFLFVHYWAAHYPYTPPPPYDRMYRRDALGIRGTMGDIERVRDALASDLPEAGRQSDALRAAYAGGVTFVDAHVGALLDGLRARGIYDEALILLTSDHGEAMDEHDEYWDHGRTTYASSTHVPLIVKLPGGRLAGTRSSLVASNVDVMPTILELTGVSPPPAVEGASFASVFDGGPTEPRPPAFSEATKPHPATVEPGAWTNRRNDKAVRSGDWKLIHRPRTGETELFDLGTDPGETRDLLRRPTRAARQRARKLLTALRTWSERAGAAARRDASDESLETLRALGYAGGE